jgi:hypothetical protein
MGKSDPTACPGVRGFTEEDWAALDRLVGDAPKAAPGANTQAEQRVPGD